MRRPENYKTRQQEAILSYIIALSGEHATASQIAEHFRKTDETIGRTTIYRHLEKMTDKGTLHRYTTDSVSGACYQYAKHCDVNSEHLHLKCEECGKLIHLDCDMLNDIRDHVFKEHNFKVNILKTVLYGTCIECAN